MTPRRLRKRSRNRQVIEERAVVTRIEGDVVYIQAINIGNCRRCAEGRGCGGGILGRLAGHSRYSVPASSRVQDLQVGESVVVGVTPEAVLSASAVVYLLPLGCMFAAGAFAQLVLGAGDLLVAAFAAAGLGLGLVGVRWRSGVVNAEAYQPRILRRDDRAADGCPRLVDH